MLGKREVIKKITPIRDYGMWFIPVLFILVSWSMLLPIGIQIDEYYHTVYAAAVVRGEIYLPIWYTNPFPDYGALVPGWINSMQQAMAAFIPPAHGTLTHGIPFNVNKALQTKPLKLEKATTDLAVLPPTLYFLYGLPTLYSSGVIALFQMRVIADVIVAAFLAYAFYLLSIYGKPRSLAVLFFIVPPGFFSWGSFPNPNGAEIAASISLSVLTTLVITDGVDKPELVKRWMIIASMICVIRTLSPLWVFFDVLCVLLALSKEKLLSLFWKRSLIKYYVVLFIAGLMIGSWDIVEIVTRYKSPILSYMLNGFQNLPFFQRVTFGIGQLPFFLTTFFFLYSLLPKFSVLELIWALCLLIIIMVSTILVKNIRYIIVIMFTIAIAVLVPPLIQAFTAHTLGLWWSGRYSAMLYLQPVIVASLLAEDKKIKIANYRRNKVFINSSVINMIFLALVVIGALIGLIVLYDSFRILSVGTQGPWMVLFNTHTYWASYPFGWQSLYFGLFVIGIGSCIYKIYKHQTNCQSEFN